MQEVKPIKQYASELIKLAMPIIMGNAGFQFIFAGDVFVAGRYSTDVLAATSIAGSIISLIFMFGIGLIISISPVLSNRLGARKRVKKFFYPTILYSQVVAFFVMFLVWGCIPIMEHMGFDEKLMPLIKTFTFIFAFSSFGAYLHAALKEFLQAYEIVFFPNFITIVSIFLNLWLTWHLAFNYHMGIAGLALASVIVRVFMGLALLVYCFVYFKFKIIDVNNKYYGTLLSVGLPISVAVSLEFLAFNSMAILMGRVSGIYAAAQSVLLVITGVSFMFPLSISNAIAVKVGYANGAKNYVDVKKYSIVGISLSVIVMAFCGVLFALFPEFFTKLFTNDADLIKVIVPIMYVCACFQVFDGFQCSMGGVLKGLKKTQMVSIANFVGYILIGLSLGSYIAFKLKLNLFGFWLGIGFSSACVGLVLLFEFIRLYKKMVKEAN